MVDHQGNNSSAWTANFQRYNLLTYESQSAALISKSCQYTYAL